MTTKLDRLVIAYLRILDEPRPAAADEVATCAYLDRLDRYRFFILNHLIRKPRYRNLESRRAWTDFRTNPHCPPFVGALPDPYLDPPAPDPALRIKTP